MYKSIKKQIKCRVTFPIITFQFPAVNSKGLVESVKGFYVLLCFLKFLWPPQHPGAVIYVIDLYYVNYHWFSNCHLIKCMSFPYVPVLWGKVNCPCLVLPWLWRALSCSTSVTFPKQKMMIHVPPSLLFLPPSCHLIEFFLRTALSIENACTIDRVEYYCFSHSSCHFLLCFLLCIELIFFRRNEIRAVEGFTVSTYKGDFSSHI